MMAYVLGRDIKTGTRIKTWFMPKGTSAEGFADYHGPLAYLWPNGARFIAFNSASPSGLTSMTVGNDDLLELAE